MDNPQEIFDSIYNEAIAKNQQSMYTWAKYKDDVSTASGLINTLTEKVSHSVMVPLGPKAYMPGKIVHTNEFLVNLGASYFAKQSAKQTIEFCNRKIKSCDEMLHNLEEELKLLTSKQNIPNTNDAFGNEQRPEIIEHVTEEEDKEWRNEHRKKEKEYRLQLAEMRQEEKKRIETEQDIWDRLDQLELEEELEDELNRLHDNADSDENSDDSDSTEDLEETKLLDSVDENLENVVETSQTSENIVPEVTVTTPKSKRKRSVIFVEDSSGINDDPIYIHFKHSSFKSEQLFDGKTIQSPSDIYLNHLQKVKDLSPVSILKVKNNPNKQNEILAIARLSDEVEDLSQPHIVSSGFEIPEVVEKVYQNVVEKVASGTRKISKFKASRMKK